MRRVNVWLLVPAVLLSLGVGVLAGRAVDDDNDAAAAKRTEVLGQQFERDETTTTEAETTTTEAETTTTAAVPVTPTTVQATTATTSTRPGTTAAPVVTTTTRPAADAACGPGSAGAGANLVVTGDGPSSNPGYTYSGPVSVANNTGKPIELTALRLRLDSADGTSAEVTVAGAAGAVIETGVTRDFNFSHQTTHPPKEGGASVSGFAYKPPGGTRNCASI